MATVAYSIVVTNVINVIYNFEKNGLSKVIYAEKVIYLFFKNKLIFWNYFFKKTNQLSVPSSSMLQTWNTQSVRKRYLSQSHYCVCRLQTMWIVDFHLVVNVSLTPL